MRYYWKGILLLTVGSMPFFLFFLWLQPFMRSELHENVLSLIAAHSDPIPAELVNLLPQYPETRGFNVAQLKEFTTITFETQDTAEKVLMFYETELEILGWRRNTDDDAGENGYDYILGQYKMFVHVFANNISSDYSVIIIQISDETKKYHPVKENNVQAKFLIETVAETYRNCSSYRDVGSEVKYHNRKKWDDISTESFKTAYIRPNKFRMEIIEDDNHNFGAARIIHADESGFREWGDACYSGIVEHRTMSEALVRTYGIPSLLTNAKDSWLLTLQELESPVEEILNEVPTYKIHGKNRMGDETVLWIDRELLILRQSKNRTDFNDFTTESVTNWDPQINIAIPDEDLEFKPFGRIPIPLGQIIVSVLALWNSTHIIKKLIAFSCTSLILAGFLHIRKTYRQRRNCA